MKKRLYWSLLAIPVLLSFGYCVNSYSSKKEFNYSFTSPDKIFKLPNVLREISGITTTEKNEIACIQDEISNIFIFDIATESIVKEYKNNLLGDFEGLALVGKTMYVLSSNGILVEYPDYTSFNTIPKEYFLNLPTAENEGLCYDKKNNRLLIAGKSKTENGIEKKSIRLIYSFNLKTKLVEPESVIRLHVKRIHSKAVELKLIEAIPGKQKDEPFKFRPSEIAVHPIDNSIFIISSQDKLLLVINQQGEIKNLIALDPVYFSQAEGMAFLSNGDLLISNEAQKGKPTLLLFKYKK